MIGHINDADIPDDWLPRGNTVRISNDCQVVLVGMQTWSMHGTIEVEGQEPVHYSNCEEFASVRDCWRRGQNLCCYIDYLMNQRGFTRASEIGALLLDGILEANSTSDGRGPACNLQSSGSWTPAFRSFVTWLRNKVNPYVMEASGQADW